MAPRVRQSRAETGNSPLTIDTATNVTFEGVGTLAGHTYKAVVATVSAADRVVSTPDALRESLFGIVSLINVIDYFKPLHVSQKFFQAADTTQTIITISGLAYSFHYIASGELVEDMKTVKVLNLMKEIGFFAARGAVAAIWLAKHGLLNLAQLASRIGAFPVVGRVVPYFSNAGRIIDVGFFTGISVIAIQHYEALMKNENFVYNLLGLSNMILENVVIAMGMVGTFHTVTVSVFGVLAATTCLMAFLVQPKSEKI